MPAPTPSLIDAILQRASLDAAFRAALLAAPERAIFEAFQLRLPQGFRIKFIERDPAFDAVHVLPDLRAADDELTDDDLDAVAGGVAVVWDAPPDDDPPSANVE